MKILILAGGAGTRLWPVSRAKNPKQVKPFIGKQTLLKETYLRVRQGFGAKDIYLAVNQQQLNLVKKDLGSLVLPGNYFIEPEKKDTAAAIGWAVFNLQKSFPDEIIATVNSDHFIKDAKKFILSLKAAEQAVKKYPGHLALVGLTPTNPETGYGYIKLGRKIANISGHNLFIADSFKEKPDQATAIKYLFSKKYLWNPAYFVFAGSDMLALFKKHLPVHYKLLSQALNKPSLLAKNFKKIPAISIDYGIMEKTQKMLCLKSHFDWADVGHWKTVYDALAKNKKDNLVKGDYVGLDSSGNLAYSYSGKLIATVGVKDFVIVETADAILVCPKSRAQEVKKINAELKKRKLIKYL